MHRLRRYAPEILLAIVVLFFTFRELGTFPDAWEDDGLFMIVARSFGEGRGYVLPILDYTFAFPYILGVGPTLILPSAGFIRLFGFSVFAARIPMALYLLVTTLVFYRFTARIAGQRNARLATGLLVTLSAFINTGKPVLGEVPAFLFLLLGLLYLERKHVRGVPFTAGIFLGLSAVTKITYGLIFPSLALAWMVAVIKRDSPARRALSTTGMVAAMIFGAWQAMELKSEPGILEEIYQYGLAEGGAGSFNVLQEHASSLLRLPFLAFGMFLILGASGLQKLRKSFSRTGVIVIVTLILLFTVHFLNARAAWYRLLLPAHLLLLPFVPSGLTVIVKHFGGTLVRGRVPIVVTSLLLAVMLAQGVWQLQYRGARLSTAATNAAAHIEKHYTETDLVIMQPEVFVRLSENPHWFFLSGELEQRSSGRFADRNLRQEEHCLPVVRKASHEERATIPERITDIGPRTAVIAPPC